MHHDIIYSSKPEEYVLKFHGQILCDVYNQVGDFAIIESWQACLNQDIVRRQKMSKESLLTEHDIFFT